MSGWVVHDTHIRSYKGPLLCVFNYNYRMGVQIPATWPTGVATQAQISPAQQLATAGVTGAAIPQTAGVVAYPIQQFQVSPQVSGVGMY